MNRPPPQMHAPAVLHVTPIALASIVVSPDGTSIAAGGSKTFTLTVSEAARADIVYTLTVNVAIPYTANITLALTTPAPGVGNTITGGGAKFQLADSKITDKGMI